jgi:hypothetical protein
LDLKCSRSHKIIYISMQKKGTGQKVWVSYDPVRRVWGLVTGGLSNRLQLINVAIAKGACCSAGLWRPGQPVARVVHGGGQPLIVKSFANTSMVPPKKVTLNRTYFRMEDSFFLIGLSFALGGMYVTCQCGV